MNVAPSLLLRGGRIIDPGAGFDAIADLLCSGGRVVDLQSHINPPDGTIVLDVAGQVVAPGFIDLHTHLRYPGFPDKETVETGTNAAAAGGFTTVCAMANTDPVVDNVAVLRAVEAEVERTALVRVRQLASVSIGLHGETLTDLPALAAAGAVAFSDDGKPVRHEGLMRLALRGSQQLRRAVSVHEEDPAIVRGGVANAPRAERLGLAPWPCRGEASLVARDLRLLEEEGGHLHVAHVSCAETVALLRAAKARELPVTAEATPHHLRLTDALLEGEPGLSLPPLHPCTKVNPPLRSARDAAALIEALADGTIDAVATDHAPHSLSDKAGSYQEAAFGFSAIETALPLLLDLVGSGAITLPVLIERLTAGPARVFGIEGGTLAPGTRADVCVFDPKAPWIADAAALRSKGKNTPLCGASLTGRVTHTIVGGQIAWTLADGE